MCMLYEIEGDDDGVEGIKLIIILLLLLLLLLLLMLRVAQIVDRK